MKKIYSIHLITLLSLLRIHNSFTAATMEIDYDIDPRELDVETMQQIYPDQYQINKEMNTILECLLRLNTLVNKRTKAATSEMTEMYLEMVMERIQIIYNAIKEQEKQQNAE